MGMAFAAVFLAALLSLCAAVTSAASTQDGMPAPAAASSARPDPPLLSPDEQLAGFVRLWSETKYNFAFFDKVPNVNWDRVLEEYIPRFAQPQGKYEYYRLLEKCLAQLHDGHTRVETGRAPDEDRPPVLIRPIEGKAVITKTVENPELVSQGVKVGCEILQVDGREVKDILEKDIYPYICASTPQMRDEISYWRILDGPRDGGVPVVIRDPQGSPRAVALTRNGRGFPRLWDDWRIFDAPRESNAAVVIRDSLAARGTAAPAGSGSGSSEPRDEHRAVFEYRDLEGSLAYVALRSFTSDEAAREFDKVFDKVKNSKGLIIDVRDNGGGSTANGYAVISRLIDRPLLGSKWLSPQYVPVFKAWGDEQKWHEGKPSVVKPAADMTPFLGPVVVLVNACTVSAAEDFLIPLNYAHRATLVGEPTAGSTGQPLVVDLPGGAALICVRRDTYPDGREFVGVGVIPDVLVRPTVEDIASGRDVVLERGIEVLKSSMADSTGSE